ncbi:D-hexose-6-phosphate mutarotase [Alcanivorax sp.]|uniref:D-hexose-6-phosphate mutarotase n=1 Tax=Alcanivorax sp. TaxID=1872427 RepID=UPI000C3EC233|nr:D-hexose-6-phosphate mutarotase [Alcanivorax sp.]MBQ23802.1 D-hexose-6-phosphate mutarotase [Alcanivorax sp.]
MATDLKRITRGELICWQLRHRGQTLVIAEQGAQVLEYGRDGAPPILWLSEQAAYRIGHGVRGGVPVCWPWFGALERNPDSVTQQYSLHTPPAHGLVRQQPWQLSEQHLHAKQAQLVFRLADQADRQHLPPVTPTLTITLSDALSLSLGNHNHGDRPVTVSQALHTYLAVADSRQITVQGLAHTPYVDALADWQTRQDSDALQFDQETDRLYLQLPSQLQVEDPLWQRQIQLTCRGSHSAVVWNPWVDKSLQLSQFAPDAWQRMLCIETARVLDNVLTLDPGEYHEMAVEIMTNT